jgi:hypothetical protein
MSLTFSGDLRLRTAARCLVLVALCAGISFNLQATVPLTLAQFTDCISSNVRGWDFDCILQSNASAYTITQTLTITRSNITAEGQYPYPTLIRGAGSSVQSLVSTSQSAT